VRPLKGGPIIKETFAKIKLLILDVDGVMTDGRIMLNDRGEETKNFDVKDGHGLVCLRQAGIEVAIISGRTSNAVDHRANELGIRDVYQGIKDKAALCQRLLREKELAPDQVCCVGDDLPDLPLFDQAGLAVAVADAVAEVRSAARLITKSKGGHGAVREICDLILNAQKKT
jgi:3-deoxy-D-manno-octulosonate 8-phosphate phosphatase (KDO 8-P phosphatase)